MDKVTRRSFLAAATQKEEAAAFMKAIGSGREEKEGAEVTKAGGGRPQDSKYLLSLSVSPAKVVIRRIKCTLARPFFYKGRMV